MRKKRAGSVNQRLRKEKNNRILAEEKANRNRSSVPQRKSEDWVIATCTIHVAKQLYQRGSRVISAIYHKGITNVSDYCL